MGKLTLGGPSNDMKWSNPSPVWVGGQYRTGGTVWMGLKPATEKDKQMWLDYIKTARRNNGKPYTHHKWDEQSLVGRHDPDWNTFSYAARGRRSPNGGLGSHCYETQLLGEGVSIKQKKIFHFTKEGDLIKDIPGDIGECHRRMDGGNYFSWVEGPAPGSEAAELLGDGKYDWDEERQLFIIVPKANTATTSDSVDDEDE